MEDIEQVKFERDEYKSKMNRAAVDVERYQKQRDDLQKELYVMEQKVIYAEQREENMKNIMTQNITESNHKLNLYIEDIQRLKATIKGMQGE